MSTSSTKDFLPVRAGMLLRVAADDPQGLLVDFEKRVGNFRRVLSKMDETLTVLEKAAARPNEYFDQPELKKQLTDALQHAETAWSIFGVESNALYKTGYYLFLNILQNYALAPGLRRKVEAAFKMYEKRSRPRISARGILRSLKQAQFYKDLAGRLLEHTALAEQCISGAKEHTEDGPTATKMKVGRFTLINSGGFSDKTMQMVAGAIKEAEHLLKASRLNQVCYGAVSVTKTLISKTLAFYVPQTDALFVKADEEEDPKLVHTILHELGHRYEKKFLGENKTRQVQELFNLVHKHERENKRRNEGKQPKPGDKLSHKGRTFTVRDVESNLKSGFVVHLILDSRPGAIATIPLESYLILQGEAGRDLTDPNFKGFVTDYALKKGSSENFAEMFAYYCQDNLPVSQSVAFEELVFGESK